MLQQKSKGVRWGLIAMIGGGVIIASVVSWRYLFSGKNKSISGGKTHPDTTPQTDHNNNTVDNSSHNTTTYASGFPLKNGSHGENVKTLQQALVRLGHPLVVDGIMGVKTTAALTAQTGSSTVESPSDLQYLVDQSWTPNYQGSMIAAPPTADNNNNLGYYSSCATLLDIAQ